MTKSQQSIIDLADQCLIMPLSYTILDEVFESVLVASSGMQLSLKVDVYIDTSFYCGNKDVWYLWCIRYHVLQTCGTAKYYIISDPYMHGVQELIIFSIVYQVL